MNDKTYGYTIHWTQSYDNWVPSRQWLDAAFDAINEHKIEQGDLQQAQEVIDRIRSL